MSFACLAFLRLAENERLQEQDTVMTLDIAWLNQVAGSLRLIGICRRRCSR